MKVVLQYWKDGVWNQVNLENVAQVLYWAGNNPRPDYEITFLDGQHRTYFDAYIIRVEKW